MGASSNLNNIAVYGGSYVGDTAMAYFSGGGYVFTISDTNLNNVRFENLNFSHSMFWFAGSGSLSNCVFNNLQCSEQGICLMGSQPNRQYPITDCNFTNLHHIYDASIAAGKYTEFDDGHGQLIAAFGIKMDRCRFENTSSTHHGGAICIADESPWGSRTVPSTINNTDFINVESKWFAVYIHANFSNSGNDHIYSPEIVENTNFINCTASEEYGAALGISHDDLIVKNCNFIDNVGGQGAAIMVGGLTNEKGTIDDTAFNGRNTKGNNITIVGCKFTNNTASKHDTAFPASSGSSGNAGAIYIFGNDTKIINSTFDSNVADGGHGAAIFIQGQRTNITNCTFVNHESINGTVYVVGDNTTVINSTFEDNKADNGAGIFILGDRTKVNNTEFNKNDATNGGAIFIDGDYTNISSSKFDNNNVTHQGGAVFLDGSHTSFEKTISLIMKLK